MTTRIELHPYLDAIVKPTVADVHRRWGDYVDRDDLAQEAAIWWYGPGQPYLLEYLAADAAYVRLRRALWRWLARYAQAEKAHRVGYDPTDQVVYRPEEVAALLPVALDPDGIPDGGGVPDETGIRAHGPLNEGGNVLAALVDVRKALASLPEEDYQFVQLADDHRHEWATLAIRFYPDHQPDSLRRRHDRLIQRMARWLSTDEEPAAA